MSLCMDLAEMCHAQSVTIVRDRAVALTVRPDHDASGEGWVVVSAAGRAQRVATSYSAASRVLDLLGADARRVVLPLLARWRYAQLFPQGSSLEWPAVPVSAWRPAASVQLFLVRGAEDAGEEQAPIGGLAAVGSQ